MPRSYQHFQQAFQHLKKSGKSRLSGKISFNLQSANQGFRHFKAESFSKKKRRN
jgi:hypothetical protein